MNESNYIKCRQCSKERKRELFIDPDLRILKTCESCRAIAIASSARVHQKRRILLLELKVQQGGFCVDCHINDLEVLEFDHVKNDKIDCVRRMTSMAGMISEAKKCVLRCANCHMIRSFQNSRHTVNKDINPKHHRTSPSKRNREYVDNIKIEIGGCELCGFNSECLSTLHFDHIDQYNKTQIVSRLVQAGYPLKTIQAEIDKCRLLCANCHRKHTLRQMDCQILDLIKSVQQY